MSSPTLKTSEKFPCNASLLLPGPAGPLETLTSCPTGLAAPATAVICHPHPLYGGSMHNKVVHTLARSFSELGLRTVRFNFRSVGDSAGEFGRGEGETEDVLAILRWLHAYGSGDEIWLAGFSFGAFMALRAAARFAVTRLVLVAPPVQMYAELGPPPPPMVPVLVLQGEQDDVVPAAGVKAWSAQLQPAAALRLFPGVGHFFHGHLNDLRFAVHEALRPEVPRTLV